MTFPERCGVYVGGKPRCGKVIPPSKSKPGGICGRNTGHGGYCVRVETALRNWGSVRQPEPCALRKGHRGHHSSAGSETAKKAHKRDKRAAEAEAQRIEYKALNPGSCCAPVLAHRKPERTGSPCVRVQGHTGNHRSAAGLELRELYKSRTAKRGTVYFMGETDSPFVKIGKASDNPYSRVKECQTGNPRSLYFHFVTRTDDAYRTENAMHVTYGDDQLSEGGTEWFRVPDHLTFDEWLRQARELGWLPVENDYPLA